MTVIQSPLAPVYESELDLNVSEQDDGDVVLELRSVTKRYLRGKGTP